LAIFTYTGNSDEKKNGNSGLEIASGICKIGDSLDFTTAEYNQSIANGALLSAGTVTLASVRGSGPASIFPFPILPKHIISIRQLGRK
jgi:hypothetical protein